MAEEKKTERSKAKAEATLATSENTPAPAAPFKVTVDGQAVGWHDLTTQPKSE